MNLQDNDIFQVILFSFIEFDLQFSAGRYGVCVADTLEIYGKLDKEPFARLCGTDLPDDVETTGNRAKVRFKTDETVNGQGKKIFVHLISFNSQRSDWDLHHCDQQAHNNGQYLET